MFDFEHEGRILRVHFRHEVPAYTQCWITERDTQQFVSKGFALCSSKDNFNREKGRKVSLSRALKNFPKEKRTEVWTLYFMRKVPDDIANIIMTYVPESEHISFNDAVALAKQRNEAAALNLEGDIYGIK